MAERSTFSIKEEFEDDGYLNENAFVCDAIYSKNNIELGDHVSNKRSEISTVDNITELILSPKLCNNTTKDIVKIEDEIDSADIKIECNEEGVLCNQCQKNYQDYCDKCGALLYILNRNMFSNTHDRVREEIPKDILELRDSFGQMGIFTLKVIPKGVRFGPFTGLNASEWSWRIKAGRLIVSGDTSTSLNWMQHINTANNISEQNLLAYQYEGALYYRSNRKIQVGEELLVCYGEEYEDNLNKGVEMVFIPATEEHVKVVFACTLCCIGFSSRIHLAKHKSICPNETNRDFCVAVPELVQCPFCKIYLEKKEYLEHHMRYCSKENCRQNVQLAMNNQMVDVKKHFSISNKHKTQVRRIYKCTKCKYKTMYNGDLRNHTNKHYEVKIYRCEKCCRRFKRMNSLKKHIENKHLEVTVNGTQTFPSLDYSKAGNSHNNNMKLLKCPDCQYMTKNKNYLKRHTDRKHIREASYKCIKCEFKTNYKQYLIRHVRIKHSEGSNFGCIECGYRTNYKSSLERHISTKHLNEANYKCEICEYKTNYKQKFKTHLNAKHLKETNYRCTQCQFETYYKSSLKEHVKSKHLKEVNYRCSACDFGTNYKSNLKAHVKMKHLKKVSYNCSGCEYNTIYKANLELHIKTKHLKESIYECAQCDYRTNYKSHLQTHTNAKHLKGGDYMCALCEFKTNYKANLKVHVNTKHVKERNHHCAKCDYKTNCVSYLRRHVKTKHLKAIDFKCALCEYKTNFKPHLRAHVSAKHFEGAKYKCSECEFGTNYKSNLKTHFKTIHLKEANYNCVSCDYKTNYKSHLKRHTKTHLK